MKRLNSPNIANFEYMNTFRKVFYKNYTYNKSDDPNLKHVLRNDALCRRLSMLLHSRIYKFEKFFHRH